MAASDGSQVKVKATAGPVLGPPWQRPENGYLVTSPQGQLTLYLEPHCVYDKTFLEKERADIVITPVIKQLLPSFTLVSGQEDAVQLAKTLCAKFIVPMQNGELDARGLLAALVQSAGTLESFKFLQKRDLDLICRAHQVVEDGYKFFADRQLVTIFAAPNYCGEFDNAGVLMSVDETFMCSFQILKPEEKNPKFMLGSLSTVRGNPFTKMKSFIGASV